MAFLRLTGNGGLLHTLLHIIHRNIHTFRSLFRRHSAIQKTLANRSHIFSNLDNMLIRVIEANNPLPP